VIMSKVKSYPIDDLLPRLKEAALAHPSVVLQAPPGSGKTTRVPLELLEVIPPEKGRIVMLEPRRIAAVSAARWMAQALGEEVGRTLGYSIRFDSRVSEKTRIEIVTEGILTRRIQADPSLDGVAMVIFDEFHERSLQADLGLALCLDSRRSLREDLKIWVMSATLDCGPVAALLGGAPVLSSGGYPFPVEDRYRPDDRERPLPQRIVEAVLTALGETSGDILVFLPGGGEIRACDESLQAVLEGKGDGISLYPLYGDLPFEAQERAILPSRKRKIVLATNIAETSITIEGVKVVIDSGLTRRLQYDPSTGMNRLITVPVSRAAAEQRKGRAGRLSPGVCYRLYSRHAFQSSVPFTPPEILGCGYSLGKVHGPPAPSSPARPAFAEGRGNWMSPPGRRPGRPSFGTGYPAQDSIGGQGPGGRIRNQRKARFPAAMAKRKRSPRRDGPMGPAEREPSLAAASAPYG
jgi:ATP-dependent helicase HrpB